MARPRKQFTEEQMAEITEMALNNCHIDTIGLALGIAKNTLIRRFGTFISQKRAEGRTELSKQQKDKCAKGDTTMLIWRGKQDLGQTDKKELTGKGGGPVALQIVDYKKADGSELVKDSERELP